MRSAAVGVLVLVLAGCAASRPAPVEERRVGAGVRVSEPDAGADPAVADDAAPGVIVRPLAVEGTERAPAAAPTPGGGSADPGAAPGNPAVVALVNSANTHARTGDHAREAATLERALEIEPRNAWLWHRLATARLGEGVLGQAAALAARSNALAGEDRELRAANWRIIVEVHRRRGEDVAAREAAREAARLAPP